MCFYIGGVGCPADWVRFKTSCYFFSTEKLTFDDALQKCNVMSSSMLIINDNEEQVRGKVKVGESSQQDIVLKFRLVHFTRISK